jgi:hypothetical protein
MEDSGEQEAADMESVQGRRIQPRGLGIDGSREKVDGIPNAPLLENSIEACKGRHGDTAG